MLSIQVIQRLFAHRRFDPLLEAVAANGLVVPLSLRVRLSQSPVAAVGLGLRRVAELAYGPTEAGAAMTRWLVERQQADGGFEGGLLATACAAAGLGRMVRDQPWLGGDAVQQAHDRALAYVAACQDERGWFVPSGEADDRDAVALATLLVLYLLGDDATFRERVRVAEALEQLDGRSHRLPAGSADLWDVVCIGTHAMAATSRRVQVVRAPRRRAVHAMAA